MKKLNIIFLVILSSLAFLNNSAECFTVSASVTKSKTLNFSVANVMSLLDDLSIYSKHFPNVISVSSAGENKSVWIYEVDPPMASSFRVTFVLYKSFPEDNQVIFESSKNDADYFYCRAKYVSLDENKTLLSLNFKIRMTRDSGGDIHFMAPLLGEKYISNKMKKDLNENADTFINRINTELRKRYGS